MGRAGYLAFTTARNEDCIAASRLLINAILSWGEVVPPTLAQLQQNSDGWADGLLRAAQRHRSRGIKPGLFMGCFKLFIASMKDALRRMQEKDFSKPVLNVAAASKALDLYGAAFEDIWMRKCSEEKNRHEDPDEILRLLALDKCRFENILDAAGDCILAMGTDCRISMANRALTAQTGCDITGKYIWEALNLGITGAKEFFDVFKPGRPVEISPFGDDTIFRMSMSSLGEVSLACSNEYIIILANITSQVLERHRLESAITSRAEELAIEKKRLEEMNITLANVLNHYEKDRDQKFREVSGRVRHFLSESLGLICADPDPVRRRSQSRLLGEQIERIFQQDETDSGRFARLTLTELKICKLIAAGHQTKAIGEMLNISSATVHTHRRNIRRKLGIRGNAAQLAKSLAGVYEA